MPQYHYVCESCAKDWEEFHSINEKVNICPFCELENFVKRIPSPVMTAIKKQKEKQTGELVKQYIEENKQVLKDYQKELKSVEK
mgnify:FL=1